MHFAIQPLRSPPQRNTKRMQQPTCHLCVPSPRSCTTHTKHSRKQKDTRHTERHMNQAPNSTQQHEKQQHTLAAYRKTQEEQALTPCTARRRAKSISSTHMQRAQNIMHFAIQPLRSPPQRNTKRMQQPTCHLCVPSPRSCTTHTKHSRKQKDTRHTERHMNQAVVRAPNSTQQHGKQQRTHSCI